MDLGLHTQDGQMGILIISQRAVKDLLNAGRQENENSLIINIIIMSQQKVIITKDQDVINEMLATGWRVVSVTAQHIAAGYGISTGAFCFVIEK